jgi:trk system potassium uptake protein TrkH
MFIMLIGASPSGTGSGLRTTSLSAIVGVITSVLRGHPDKITFMGRIIPTNRVLTAVASAMLYGLILLVIIPILATLSSERQFMDICFEAVTALGNTGMHLDVDAIASSPALSKVILIITMFIGRVSPLTFGYAFFCTGKKCSEKKSDLAL